MSDDEKIDYLRCRFASEATEREYLAACFRRNLATNRIGILVGVPLFSIYAFADFINLADPVTAVAYRACAAVGALALAVALGKSAWAAKRYEWVTVFVVCVLGGSMIAIIWREDSLDNYYYVGLVQAAVIQSFLIRMSFERAMIPLLFMLVAFAAAVSGKADRNEATLQLGVLVTMFSMCGFGIYVAERLRRIDFLKTRLIAKQNEQLNAMLEETKLDNARKVAAMNLLVHFVRTPIHQIVGFTDVLTNSLDAAGQDRAPKDCVESAGFIRSASRELFRNVSQLLTYYRLDEKAAAPAVDLVELQGLIEDFTEELPGRVKAVRRLDRVAIMTRQDIVIEALKALCTHYAEAGEGPARIEIRLVREGDLATITVVDDLPVLGEAEFERQTRPLDRLDHYLTANGTSMPMALRTAARASELAGGGAAWREQAGRNAIILTFRDYAAEARTARDVAA
jgi:signal transduction histidine kinase